MLTCSLVYKDERILALNKKSGVHTAFMNSSDGPSVASEILHEFPEQAEINEDPASAGLISRLDFETSGLLVAARTKESFEQLKLLMKQQRLTKKYLAVVDGEFPEKALVSASIGSRYRRSKKVHCFDDNAPKSYRAQEAETQFQCISVNLENNISLVQAEFCAGKRHQVRAHAAHCGNPLYGDRLYGQDKQPMWNSTASFLLHSSELKIEFDDETLEVLADLPDYFDEMVKGYFS